MPEEKTEGVSLIGKIVKSAGVEVRYIDLVKDLPFGLVFYSICGVFVKEKLRIDLDKEIFLDLEALLDSKKITQSQKKILEAAAIQIVEFLAERNEEKERKQRNVTTLILEREKYEQRLAIINKRLKELLKD